MTAIDTPAIGHQLRQRTGDVPLHLPGEPEYEATRLPWNLASDLRPAAVALPRTTDEVAAVVTAAVDLGLQVAPQGTGHGAGAMPADLADTVLLKTTAMRGVTVDPAAGLVTAQAGAWWIDAVEAAAPHGLAVLHGSSPDVGVVGYSLSGGIGWYARAHGMQVNAIVEAEVVTGTGQVVRASGSENPDLFWALRGGGGSFGVVTALTFRALRFDHAHAGMMVWDASHAAELLPRWARWAADAPEEVTTSFRLMSLPPIEEIPEPFRGRQLVIVDGAVLADDERAGTILQPLRTLPPEVDTFARVPVTALSRLHMDPEDPSAAVSGTAMLQGLPDEAMDSLLAAVGPGSGSTLVAVELRQLGGALGRPAPAAGALPQLDGQFLLYALGLAMTPEMAADSRRWADAAVTAVQPWVTGSTYLNFADDPVDVATAFPAASWDRLQVVRQRVDPRGTFRAQHPVTLPGS